jgi:SagB-type dehydrogenase family enzyme
VYPDREFDYGGETPVPQLAETIRLREDARFSCDDDGRWRVVRRGHQLRLPPLPPLPDKLVDELLHAGFVSGDLVDRLGRPETAVAEPDAFHVLGLLRAGGWLQRCLALDGRPFVTVCPIVKPQQVVRRELAPGSVVRLSRFSHVRGGESGHLTLTAPTAHEQVIIHDSKFLCLLQTLAASRPVAEVRRAHEVLLGERALGHVLLTLLGLGLLVEVPASGPADDEAGPFAFWDFEELLFHCYSREGRADTAHGATYRKEKQASDSPATAPRLMPSRVIELPPPNRSGAALRRVLEARHSTREYAEDQPIGLDDLGGFLGRACGLVSHSPQAAGGPPQQRPYPGAGGLYELQVYPVVRFCERLDPAVYRYDPQTHRLELVAPYDAKAGALLRQAGVATAMRSDPQILLIISARFAPVMRKYDAIAYSLILKDVGVLIQTMYLVATQLRLGCCAVGGGRPVTTTNPMNSRRFNHV